MRRGKRALKSPSLTLSSSSVFMSNNRVLSLSQSFQVATVIKATADVSLATGPELHIELKQDETSPNLAVVQGVEVIPLQVTDVLRINCGGPTVVDVLGRTWNADTAYQPGGDVVTPSQYTTVALAPGVITDSYGAVLATERWSNTGMGALRYVIRPPVVGTYRLQFVFAEVWHREVGTRIFDVDVQVQSLGHCGRGRIPAADSERSHDGRERDCLGQRDRGCDSACCGCCRRSSCLRHSTAQANQPRGPASCCRRTGRRRDDDDDGSDNDNSCS
jgi:hypothetical protein